MVDSSRQIWRIIMSKQKHLTIDERTTIEVELGKRSSFKAIALLIGKDCTTISKEIRSHRISEKTTPALHKYVLSGNHLFVHTLLCLLCIVLSMC